MDEPEQPSSTDADAVMYELWWLAWYGTIAPGLRADFIFVANAVGTFCDDPIPPDPDPNPDEPPEPPPPPPQPATPYLAQTLMAWCQSQAPTMDQGRFTGPLASHLTWAENGPWST